MRELLLLAADRTNQDAASFFHAASDALERLDERCFSALWSEVCRSLSVISNENRRELEELGLSLGRYELQDQLAACDRYLTKTQAWLDRRREAMPERRRLALSLGAAAGLFVCLLTG